MPACMTAICTKRYRVSRPVSLAITINNISYRSSRKAMGHRQLGFDTLKLLIWLSHGERSNQLEPPVVKKQQKIEPIPADIGGEKGYILDGSPVHYRADT